MKQRIIPGAEIDELAGDIENAQLTSPRGFLASTSVFGIVLTQVCVRAAKVGLSTPQFHLDGEECLTAGPI